MITIALPNIAEFKASLDDVARNQIPFATSRALNEVGKLAQLAVRNHTGQIFHVRRQAWVNAAVKITHFATKYEDQLYLAMGIHALGDESRSDILGKFETETVKLPHVGSHVVLQIGPNRGKILREGQRFSDYHFTRQGNSWKGDRGTFMVRTAQGNLLVLQEAEHRTRYKRGGKSVSVKAHDNIPLFLLVPSQRITPNLDFEKTVREVVEKTWEFQISHALDDAIRNAK